MIWILLAWMSGAAVTCRCLLKLALPAGPADMMDWVLLGLLSAIWPLVVVIFVVIYLAERING